MPWRGPAEPGEFPTLGYLVGDWIEATCVIPDGVDQGRPYLLTDEMWRFLLWYYRLHPGAVFDRYRPSRPFAYRGGQLMRPQKWGKGPFAAGICLAEAFGPVQFAGWDADGEPVGREHPTPWVQLVANSEEQTDNTWLALYEMATRGGVADIPGVDIGKEDINLPSGGKVEAMSASGRARLGTRLSFGLFDETGLMTETTGGVHLVKTMKRNIAGMSGRWLETTNAYDPSENSVAQRTQDAVEKDTKAKRLVTVLVDYRRPRRVPDLDDTEAMLAELRYLYEASWWVDVERILADCRDESVCPVLADAYRFFLNHPTVGVSDAVDATRWDAQAVESTLSRRDRVALGFDGSRTMDCTALVAVRLHDGRWFPLGCWDPADYPGGEVPRGEVHQAVRDAFRAYRVAFLYADPAYWEDAVEAWAAKWPDQVVKFSTNKQQLMDRAIVRFISRHKLDLTHDGDPRLTAHAKAAALVKGGRRQAYPNEDTSVPHFHLKIGKKTQGHPIDLFVAGLLGEEARGRAIEGGILARPGPATGQPAPADPATGGRELVGAGAGAPAGNPWRQAPGRSPWQAGGRLNL